MQVLNQVVEVNGVPCHEYIYEPEIEIELTCGSCRHFENRGRVSVCRVTHEWDDYMKLTVCKEAAGSDLACPKHEDDMPMVGAVPGWDDEF